MSLGDTMAKGKDPIGQALRKLIGKRSAQPATYAIGELCPRDESPSHDRALALVGGSFIDDGLQQAILKHLSPDRVEWIKSNLFDGELAPLATMASRTRMAYALGIFSDDIRKDLATIRGIRNAFAHATETFTFQHEYLQKALNELTILKPIKFVDKVGGPSIQLLRLKYATAVSLLCHGLAKYDPKSGNAVDAFLYRARQPRPPDQKSPNGTRQAP